MRVCTSIILNLACHYLQFVTSAKPVATMDIDLARTSLQVVRTGNLLAVADKLHVTQTAVTARIKSLERN